MTRASNLTLVGASAGSGKTHRLTSEVTSAVDPSSPDAIPVEGLVAVTYTRKAAAELGGRLRQRLVAVRAFDRAQRLPLAYLGTVHAVCLRIVQELAIDAGVSPAVDVLPGSETALLAQALDWGLEPELKDRLDRLARQTELRIDNQRGGTTDWLTPVRDIMTLARGNRIAPDCLSAMAERSVTGLLALMTPSRTDGDAMDAELLSAVRLAASALDRYDDGQAQTKKARETLAASLALLEAGELPWSGWLKLAKIGAGKGVAQHLDVVREIASQVDHHPRLHAQLRELTESIFEAARRGLAAYADWKQRRRIMDYVDMIDRALTLLEDPAVAAELATRTSLVVVDELQDTSPVQLALFLRLHVVAGRSMWVGDPKQCIFEYAGADPALMDAVEGWARANGAKGDQLLLNRRSRPELVHVCNRIFETALARHGFDQDKVRVGAHRESIPALAPLPALGVFHLTSSSHDGDAACVAEGVRRMLADPELTPVQDRHTGNVRPVRPGDVAVLVSTNAQAMAIANHLAHRGIRAALARPGLLATPEGTLVEAALRALVDDRDTSAVAILEALTGFQGKSPDAWLADRIVGYQEHLAARERGEHVPRPTVPALARLRPSVEVLAPTEIVDRVLTDLDVATLCARWSQPEQRLANLDAVRTLAQSYEERCAYRREAATVAGLLRYFEEAATPVLTRDEERANDEQHVESGDGAVTLSTFHKSKGLEWPVVILATLDRDKKRDAFEVRPESDGAAFDPENPLSGRWIRYWPWPYGAQSACPLAVAAEASDVGRAVNDREEAERARLLYVGFTRARDHVVLAVRVTKGEAKAGWLDELRTTRDEPVVVLPTAVDGSGAATVGLRDESGDTIEIAARCWTLTPDAPEQIVEASTPRWFASVAPAPRAPYWIAPSRAADEWTEVVVPTVGTIERLGDRLPVGSTKGVESDVVGTAVHNFLAADVEGLSAEARLAIASRILGGAELLAVFAPATLLEAGDRLRAWVDQRFPGARWLREVPIAAHVGEVGGERRVDGTIDLLLETAEGVVVVDHKSYVGGAGAWPEKAGEFGAQLGAYAEVVRHAGKRVHGVFVHFPVGGGVVELVLRTRAPAKSGRQLRGGERMDREEDAQPARPIPGPARPLGTPHTCLRDTQLLSQPRCIRHGHGIRFPLNRDSSEIGRQLGGVAGFDEDVGDGDPELADPRQQDLEASGVVRVAFVRAAPRPTSRFEDHRHRVSDGLYAE